MNLLLIAIFWALAIWAFSSRRPVLLYLFFASMPFGAFAVVPPELTAGLTFTATPIVTVLIIIRAAFSRGGPAFFTNSAVRIERLGLLFLFWLLALLATIFMPRIFEGDIMVVPIRGVLSETTALGPTPQNLSTMIYMSISIFAVFAFAYILRSRADRQTALVALCFGATITVLTGLVDYMTLFLPIEPLLEPLRTATYALATDVELLGSKRVVGLMPEASTFGGLCLAFLSALVFFRRTFESDRMRKVYVPIIIAALLICCYISTSSGTYVGLGVLAVVVLAEAMFRALSSGRTRHLYRQDLLGELAIVGGLIALVGVLVIAFPHVTEPVYEMFDRMVLQKTGSSSFEERGMWRTVAYESIFSSYGLGVGLGGTRASSSLVSIFSATGIIGGVLFYSFVLLTLLRRSRHLDWEGQFIVVAVRCSFIPPFVMGLVVGGAEFGPLDAFSFGIVTAVVFSKSNRLAKQQAGGPLADPPTPRRLTQLPQA